MPLNEENQVSEKLLKIIVCPVTKQPLSNIDPATLSGINALIREGRLTNTGGVAVLTQLDGALVRQDGRVVYPVHAGIPVLLAEDGIPLPDKV